MKDDFAFRVYSKAGFNEEQSQTLSSLVSVLKGIDRRLKESGKPSLSERLRKKREAIK